MKISFNEIIERLKGLDQKYQYAVFGLALLFFFSLDYFFLLCPQMRSLSKINRETKILVSDLDRVRNDVKRIDQNKKQLERARLKLAETRQIVRAKEEIPLILEDITKAARQEGVKILQVMPIKEGQTKLISHPQGDYYSLPILIQARSSYHALGKFLNQLEKTHVLLSVKDFSLLADEKDTTHHLVQMTIKTIIFEPPEGK